jgi:hypothetical protein
VPTLPKAEKWNRAKVTKEHDGMHNGEIAKVISGEPG